MRILHWLGFLILSVSLAGAQPRGADSPLLHEPIPRPGRVFAGPSDDPALLLEEGSVAGLEESSGATESSEGPDLVYRTAGTKPVDEETVYSVQETMRPDAETAKEPWLQYHAVFDPAVIPFKRNHVWDAVQADGTLRIGRPALDPVAVVGDLLLPDRETFWGTLRVDLDPNTPISIPSVAPSMRILSVDAAPDIPLSFYQDGADNLYVSAGDFGGRVSLNIHVDAPTAWFQRSLDEGLDFEDIPHNLAPKLPPSMRADADTVLQTIGVGASSSFYSALTRTVDWFRSFRPGQMPRESGRLYKDLALGKRGICRHRAYAFVVTAHALGIPARYAANEGHAFVEVYVPDGKGWLRVDLGGSAQGMNVHSGRDKRRHIVAENDPFSQPAGFRGTYSHRSVNPDGEPEGGSDPIRGLPGLTGEGTAEDTAWEAGLGTSGRMGESNWPAAARVLPYEESRSKRPTQIQLNSVSSRVFRGGKLTLTGRVQSQGVGIDGGLVRVGVINADGSVILHVLGTVRTDSDGLFDAVLTVPLSVPVGSWDIVAEYQGDAVHAPARSQ